MSEVACSSSNNQSKTIFANQFQDYDIEIFGTKDEPLFKAKQIGDMLGIVNIRKTLEGIDEDYKILKVSNSGLQEQYFVTEEGLYEILFTTKSDKAKPFRKWAAMVIKEIRKNGEYNLKRQLEQQGQRELELTNQLLQLQQSNEEKGRLAAELEALKKTKKYEEVEKTGCNYTLKTDSVDFYRNGMSKNKDCKNRVSSHQTSNEQKIVVLHEFKTSCPKLLESCIHYALELSRSNSGREFFRCKLDHIVNIVDIIGHVLDTCRSSFPNISRDELIEKVLEKLDYRGGIRTNEELEEVVNTVSDDLRQWLIQNIIRNGEGRVALKDIAELYTGRTKIHSSESCKIKKEVECYIKDCFDNQNYKMLDKTVDKRKFRGWKGYSIK